jgi:hypothetical protein
VNREPRFGIHRSVNVSSISTITGTARPASVPGMKRQSLTVFSASSSRPKAESSDPTICAVPTDLSGSH